MCVFVKEGYIQGYVLGNGWGSLSTLYHLLYSHELGGNKYRSILSISPQQLKPYYPQMNLKISIVSIMNICIRYHLFDVTSIVKLQVVFTS